MAPNRLITYILYVSFMQISYFVQNKEADLMIT